MSTKSEEASPGLPVFALYFCDNALVRTSYDAIEAHVGGRSEGCFEFLAGVRALVCLVLYSAARTVARETKLKPWSGQAHVPAAPKRYPRLVGGPDSLVPTFHNLKGKAAPAWLSTLFGKPNGKSVRIEDLVCVTKPRDSQSAQQSRPAFLTGKIVDPERVKVYLLPRPDSLLGDGVLLDDLVEINRLAGKLEQDHDVWTQKLIGESVQPSAIAAAILELDPYYSKLMRRINLSGESKRAVLIQSSNTSSAALVADLLRADFSVELFVHDPDWATPTGSPLGVDDARQNVWNRYDSDGGELLVRFYRTPASLRMVWVLEGVLAVGWYTYHQNSSSLTRETGYSLVGHKRPNLVANPRTEPYELLLDMVQSILTSMRKHAGEPFVHLKRDRLPKSHGDEPTSNMGRTDTHC